MKSNEKKNKKHHMMGVGPDHDLFTTIYLPIYQGRPPMFLSRIYLLLDDPVRTGLRDQTEGRLWMGRIVMDRQWRRGYLPFTYGRVME